MKAIQFLLISLLSGILNLTMAQERKDIEEKYKWDLTPIFANDDAWELTRDSLKKEIENIDAYKGRLSESSETLYSALKTLNDFSKELIKVYTYASMKSDQDKRNSKYIGMLQEAMQLYSQYSSKASYTDTEILAMDSAKVFGFINENKNLEPYRFPITNVFRTKKHTLSLEEEKILAETSLMSDAPNSVFSIFANAELPYPEVTLSDGAKAIINQAGYSKYRASENRADRELVFKEFWTTMSQFKGTFAQLLYSQLKKDYFYAKTRNYSSALEKKLDADNIPIKVYSTLVDNINNNLATFHRYLKIKKQMLKVDTLKYSDLYAPVVENLNLTYSYEDAQELIIKATKPLGKEYSNVLQKAYNNHWIDVYPNTGKRSGAYSSGYHYDGHPYILMNYNEKYEDVSTLAHELGHSMHSYFSNKTQPYPLANYAIFVAEVPSTLNEYLLNIEMRKSIKGKQEKLALLMGYLDRMKGTLFRQVQFAEFEMRIHELAESGKPVTAEILNNLYLEILKKYYGHDEGICKINDLYAAEWSFVPHFYYTFYVYQYATSLTASIALGNKIINNEKGIIDKYIELLSSGSSDYPINLLKKAGVDMTSPEPFDLAMKTMNELMDEIESLTK